MMPTMMHLPLLNFEITAKGETAHVLDISTSRRQIIGPAASMYTMASGTHIAITCALGRRSDPGHDVYQWGSRALSQRMDFTPVMLSQPMKIGEDSRFAHYFKGEMADLRLVVHDPQRRRDRKQFQRRRAGG